MVKRSVRRSRSAVAAVGRSWRFPVWEVVAALVVVGGVMGSVLAAGSVAGADADRSRVAFERSSDEVASALQLAIHEEESLVVNAGAFVVEHPGASNARFARWLSSVQAFERHPELDGMALVVLVRASELAAFATRAVADPSGPLAPDGTFQVVPVGDRASYCFVVIQRSRAAAATTPAGFDLCADPTVSEALITARDTGTGSYLPVAREVGNGLVVQVPIFRGVVTPATVAARRELFVGSVGVQLNPTLLLERALQGRADTAATLRYQDGYSDVQFSSGTVPEGARSVTIDLDDGWTVETFATVASGGVWGDAGASALLVAGVALSVALGLLVLVLGTGRARALRLVAERTGELRHQALHDALTGLPSRALIIDRVEQLLVRSRRNGTQGAVLFVDLDEFKGVNDTFGHAAGDGLLIAVAARLATTLRDADTIGRLGGDEFVVLLDGASLDVAPELVAERLLEVMRAPFELDGAPIPLWVNTSIGIATGDRASAGELLHDADVALYHAKAARKNRYETFRPEMQTELSRRVELEFDLRSALTDGQFRLVYQPIYNLDDLTLVGVEALLRWDHPTHGLILPDDFVPILERNGQIEEVGSWVLRQACEQMADWHTSGDILDVSVNVSGRQFDSDTIVDRIRDALDTSGLDATSLIIEITETALAHDPDTTARRLRAIKALGVRIAVDDFGTGYSSLAYLQQFPVDCLKIDRVFTNAIATSPESKALIGTLVQLGKDLGLSTLAEGVETATQMDHLRGQHVDQAQGFLFARPLHPDTLETQLLAPTRPAPAS